MPTPTRLYRTLVSRAVAGESVFLIPTEARLGTGRYPGAFTVDDTGLDQPVITSVPVTVSRAGQQVTVRLTVPGNGSGWQISEAGLFTAGGVPVLLDSFPAVSLEAGITLELSYVLLPEDQ